MPKVRIVRHTAVGGKGVEPGQVLTLSDADARALVTYRKAVYVDADGSPVPQPADPGILTSDALAPYLDPKADDGSEPATHPDNSPEEEEEEKDTPEVVHVEPVVQHRDPQPRRRGR